MKYFSKRYLIIFSIIFLVAGNLAHILFPETYWILTGLHSSMEAIGAVLALLLALLVLQIRKYHTLSFFYVWIICGLTGMGTLDLLHSIVDPGETFVWLHTIAVFTGGLFFALVWVPEQKIPARYLSLLPGTTFISALLLGLFSIVLPDFIPAMFLAGGSFSQTAHLLNLSGGLLFIAAAVWFVKEYIRDKALDSLLFSTNSFLFGVAGILFYFSDPWDIGWWHWHAVRLAAYLIAIYYSFSAYKELTDQIQDQKDKAQRYLDVAASILAVIDVNEKVVLINRKGCMLLGFGEEEITGRNWFDAALPEKSRNDARFFFRRLISDTIDQYTHFVAPVLTRKGEERLIAWHNTLLKDEEGRIKSVLVSGEDVTDRMKAEEELWQAHQMLETRVRERTAELEKTNILLKQEIYERRISEERFRGAFESAAIGMGLVSLEGRWLKVNTALCNIVGYSEQEMLSLTFQDLTHPGDIDADLEFVRQMLAGKIRNFHMEKRYIHKDGHIVWILLSASLVRDENGVPLHFVGQIQDITRRKTMEDRIRASLKEKEVLLQEIHHRVKNNMTVISSLLKLQADKVTDEHYKELFNESTNRIKTMALIHEKLYRSEDLAQIVFSDYLRDMIDNILGSYCINTSRVHLKRELERITLALDTSIPCGLIVNELLSNSLKYAFPDGRSGEIRVSLRKNNGNVELMVGDDGVGLPNDLDFRNTGSLGLNIVAALVRQIRGNIDLQRDRGTKFLITFRSDT